MAKDKKENSALSHAYLIFYNFVQTLGWTYLFIQVVGHYLNTSADKTPLYDKIWLTVSIFQNLAILEVVHAFTKIVPSNPMITLQQIASRVILVCGVLMVTETSRVSYGLPLLLFAWSITEIIRYANYTLNLLNAVPYFLVWLRYSTFIILYPIGVTGELLCLYNAQKELADTGSLSIVMPNRFNFIFYYPYVLRFVMMLYLPLFPQMYLHMVYQRKKVLGAAKQKKT